MFVGHVDLLQRPGVAGWAGDTDYPDSHIEIAILLDGQECARVLADKPRPDLQALGTFGDGHHGFEYIFEKPLSALKSYEICVQFTATNELVPAGRATLHAEPVLFTAPLSPIIVSAIDPGDAGVMVRALGEHPQIITADLPGANLQLLSYYARAAEVMNSPSNAALGLAPLSGATEHLTVGRNPFHHPSFQQIFPRKRMLHEFFARSAGRTIGSAFRSVVLDLYQEVARQQNKHEARRFAERSDLFDVTADFARTAFQQTTNIVVTRDLRDLYCAARDRWFTTHLEIVEHLRGAYHRMQWLGRVHRDETIFIKFEDLLAAPGQVLAEVWRVLGLDPMSRGLNEDRIGLTKARDAAGVERWKTELDSAQRATIEQALGDCLHRFGYATEVDGDPAPCGPDPSAADLSPADSAAPTPTDANPTGANPTDANRPDPGPPYRDLQADDLTPDHSPPPADPSADAPGRSARTRQQVPTVPASS